MSGIEIIGIAASVIQIADAGARLSSKLFVFTRKVKDADRTIQDISREIAATGAALRELGEALEQDKYASLGSRHSFDQTSQIVADCWEAFTEINETIGGEKIVKDAIKGQDVTNEKVSSAVAKFKSPSLSFKQRFKFPFKEPQINMLRTKLESLKSSLMLMLQVLMLAEQVRNRPKAQISDEQKELLKTLHEEKLERDLDLKKACMAIEAPPTVEPEPQKVEATEKADSVTLVSVASDQNDMEDAGTPRARSFPDLDSVAEPLPEPVSIAARALPVMQANLVTSTDLPLLEPTPSQESVASKASLKWASTKSSFMSSSETLGSFSTDPNVPPSLRLRDEEIQHHAMLVHNLLEEISDVQYRIDHGIRHRMHDGVLKIHWDEWTPHATKHGKDHFHRAFENHKHVSRYWHDLNDGIRPVPLPPPPTSSEKKLLHFKDALNRQYDLPLEDCLKWPEMMEMISDIFADDFGFKDQVGLGRFNLKTEDKKIIMPRLWEKTIEAGMTILMEMKTTYPPQPINIHYRPRQRQPQQPQPQPQPQPPPPSLPPLIL